MKPSERHEWIRQWIKSQGSKGSADVMDSEFVASYIDATGAAFLAQTVGADTCRQLGRDLSAMYKVGSLRRGRIGLTDHYQGMPNWVYVYRLEP